MNRSPFHRATPLILLCWGCAQVDMQGGADAGALQPLRVADVQPSPGPVDAAARFRVAFSAPMDASLLLIDADHSETVVLVGAASVELVAAALSHGRLSAHLRAALVPAHAVLDSPGEALDLVPDQPLAAGEWWLLVASRLKDAQGRKLSGNGARFGFTVGATPALPRLVAPRGCKVRGQRPFAARRYSAKGKRNWLSRRQRPRSRMRVVIRRKSAGSEVRESSTLPTGSRRWSFQVAAGNRSARSRHVGPSCSILYRRARPALE